jgi:hypothetical protein
MKKKPFLLILIGSFALSFLSNAGAQNPYNLLLDSTFTYNWDNSKQDWIFSQKVSYNYIYGPENKLAEMNQYDNAGNLVLIESRSYTDSTMTRILKKPDKYSWINWQKYFTLYDDIHKEIYSETYVWSDNEWFRADKVFWKYDGDYLVQLIRQYLVNGIFQDAQQIDYINNNDGHLTEYLITDIPTNTPVRRILYTYNDLGQRTEGLQQSWLTGNWSISGKSIFSYNSCGQLQEITGLAYSNNAFVNSTKLRYFYSPHFFESSTKKIAICHNGHTIYVSKNAVSAHLAHGDCIGECSVEKIPERRGFDDHEKPEKPPFTCYPNPARDKVTIKFDNGDCRESQRVELTDFYGKLVKTFNIKGNSDLTINRNNLHSGKYYLRLSGEEVYSALIIFE